MQLNKQDVTEQDTQSLKDIINGVFSVNIMKKSREMKYVDARLIYAKILRDRGYTLKSIGKSINKDHTTVIHYMSQVDHLLKHNFELMEKYLICKDSFIKGREPMLQNSNELDLQMTIINLKSHIDELILERNAVLKMDEKYKRLRKIIELIDNRTPKGDESFIERQINHMFNGFTERFRAKTSRQDSHQGE